MSTGLYVNCGSYRPRWLRSKRNRVAVHFSFPIAVPAGLPMESAKEMQESVREMISLWSRSCWVKIKKDGDKRKRLSNGKNERD
jgi:hypothetical protein